MEEDFEDYLNRTKDIRIEEEMEEQEGKYDGFDYEYDENEGKSEGKEDYHDDHNEEEADEDEEEVFEEDGEDYEGDEIDLEEEEAEDESENRARNKQKRIQFFSKDALRIDVNLPLLKTKKPTEFYGFAYPEPNPSLVEEPIAFSFNDIEDVKRLKSRYYPLKHQFLNAAYEAFDKHYGFVLSPSQLYLLVLQQVSIHRNQNKNKFEVVNIFKETADENDESSQRNQNQKENNKVRDQKIIIQNLHPDIEGEDEWHPAIQQIRQQISSSLLFPEHHYSLLTVSDFNSSTTIDEIIASEISLLNICTEFHELHYIHTLCGIPYFILDGTNEEWILLQKKIQQLLQEMTLSSFHEKWLPILNSILNKLILAKCHGEIDLLFWKNFFKKGEKYGSGAYTYINGWINIFFPLTSKGTWNPFCLSYDEIILQSLHRYQHTDTDDNGGEEEEGEGEEGDGLNITEYPMGLGHTPVYWNVSNSYRPLQFYAGFIGCLEGDDCLKPMVGWWITRVTGSDQNYREVHREMEHFFASSSTSFH